MRECLWHRVWEACKSVWICVGECEHVCVRNGVSKCASELRVRACVWKIVCEWECARISVRKCIFERELMCVRGGVYARGVQRSPSGIDPQEPPTFFFEAGSLTSVALTTQVGLAGQWAPGIHTSLPSHHWGTKEYCSAHAFHTGSGDCTQVFSLVGQTLYQLN